MRKKIKGFLNCKEVRVDSGLKIIEKKWVYRLGKQHYKIKKYLENDKVVYAIFKVSYSKKEKNYSLLFLFKTQQGGEYLSDSDEKMLERIVLKIESKDYWYKR